MFASGVEVEMCTLSCDRIRVGLVEFAACNLDEVVSFFVSAAPASGMSVHFANAYSLALAEADSSYLNTLNEGDFVFMDGQPVVWVAKVLHRVHHRKQFTRVYGPDVMRGILAASGSAHRHFLLGSTPTTLSKLEASIHDLYPNAHVVGSYSPPFSEVADPHELRTRDERIAEVEPTHVWVGLGTPKQDFEVARLAGEHRAFVFGVGAAFDFLSGSSPEAPQILKTLGLQWAHRLLHEPRRLAKRYLWGNSRFVWTVLRTSKGIETK